MNRKERAGTASMKPLCALILALVWTSGRREASAAESPMRARVLAAADGERLSYSVGGNDEGTTVVLLHGFPFSSAMWAAQVEALKKDYHVVACDLRGAGKSRATKGPFTMEMLTDDFFALLDREKIPKAVVVGFSMGGFLALRAVERAPERFRALVLADTKSAADSNESKLKRTEAVKTVRSEGVAAYADVFLKAAAAPATLQGKPELMRRLKDLVVGQASKEGVVDALFALMSRTDTTESLAKIKVPTLILVGDSDVVTPLAAARALREAIAGSELEIVPGAGHMSPVENPKAFSGYLLKFLAGLR